MGVVDRLKRLTGEDQPKPDDKQALLNDLRRRIDAIMARRDQPVPATPARLPRAPLAEVVTGEEVANAHGAFFFSRTRHPGDFRHGSALVRDLIHIDMPAAGLLANQPGLAAYTPHEALFLDTETTGLSGGTGTLPFLIGLGWFEGPDFITCQLFARDYSEERAMLAFLQETAAGKRFLITFNGKAFDINLLTTRFVLNRLADPLAGMPHLDLLNPSRKLLAHRTSNCRLVTLEDEILGFTRVGDVPGWEIPQRYFAWLRSRNAHLLADVFEHNRYDIVSMAALACHLTQVLAHGESHHHPGDLLAAARLLHERGHIAASQSHLETLIATHAAPQATEAQKLLSLIHKRHGHWHLAVPAWEEILAQNPGDTFAAAELAKFCEHRSRDYSRAVALVRQALTHRLSEREQADLAHRLERLLTKEAGKFNCHAKEDPGP